MHSSDSTTSSVGDAPTKGGHPISHAWLADFYMRKKIHRAFLVVRQEKSYHISDSSQDDQAYSGIQGHPRRVNGARIG